MAKVYYEKDADLSALDGKKIAVIGYGNQGRGQALNLRDSGLDVVVGIRPGGKSDKLAKEDGIATMTVKDAAEAADIIHILIPDEVQAKVYSEEIESGIKEGNAVSFSHGFNIRFGRITPPEGVDVFMIAPKGPGFMVREVYEEGFGVPALVAVEKDESGKAKEIALAFAKGIGATRAGVIETTFTEETETDLFGEQVDLCGGIASMITSAFETLVKNGYQPEIAYFEVLHEMKLITDLIQSGGIENMWEKVSNTAEYGGRTRGSWVINKESVANMQKALDQIKSGEFAKEFIAECDAGMPNMKRMREESQSHQIEQVGKGLRGMFDKK